MTNKFLRHGWLAVLAGTVIGSIAAYSYLQGQNAQHIQQITSQTAEWVLAIGLILGALLTLLVYNRSRYGEQLRRDIAARTQELSGERETLASVIDHATESILMIGENGLIQRANPAACEMFDYRADEWEGLALHDLVPDDIREQHVQWFADEIGGKRHDILGKTREVRGRRKDGAIFPCEITITAFQAVGGQCFSLILRNLTERKNAEQRLTWLSCYDELTELPNRRLFTDRLDQAIAMARREKRSIAVLYIDIDRFKIVNDTLGHASGDQLLKDAGSRLQKLLRESDTAARLGGDEFVVMLSTVTPDTAMRVARKIEDAMRQPYRLAGQELILGASIGMAIFPNDGTNSDDLIKHADTAMYHAKKNHLHIHYFSSGMENEAIRRMQMEQELGRAAHEDQLKLYYQSQHALTSSKVTPFPLHYQPKYQLTDGAIIGVEGLVRWQHPVLGMVFPSEFIPLAEETGLIRPITHWVIAEAARQTVEWENAGIRPQRVGINVSAVQLMQEGLAQEILSRINEAGARPEWIEIEITETAAMREPEIAIGIMRELADAGVSLAIDDFGTGYSSLAYLKRLPAKWLKIDIAFIRDLPDDEEDAAIVRSIIAMAHALGMSTIAEGVETMAQLEFLRGEGCDAVQGYLFSKPLPADKATVHIMGNRNMDRHVQNPDDDTALRAVGH